VASRRWGPPREDGALAGAQRGICAAIARRLAADGASLWINAVEELDRAQELALGLGGEVVEADITDSEQVERVGSPDIVVVNNAADQSKQALLEADPCTRDRTLAVNITGAVLTMQASIPRLGARGSIVAVASMHSFVPLAGAAAYATSKAELAPKLDSSPRGPRPQRLAARLRRRHRLL
jgi:NAD(P)-dependent dehydrogenase (short-subunit alcohol dehydrogenase family)